MDWGAERRAPDGGRGLEIPQNLASTCGTAEGRVESIVADPGSQLLNLGLALGCASPCHDPLLGLGTASKC